MTLTERLGELVRAAFSGIWGQSHEHDENGRWLADLSPVGGPGLRPFVRRSEALDAEVAWLEANWLG